MVKAIPEGFYTVTPTFTFKDCKKAIEFYKKAFNGKKINCKDLKCQSTLN